MSDLVGPLPEVPDTPRWPTPWRRNGNEIYDATGQYVPVRVWIDHDTQSTARELAQIIVGAVNGKYSRNHSAGKPRAYRDAWGDDWWEVAPDMSVHAPSRKIAQERFERFGADIGNSRGLLEWHGTLTPLRED